MRSPSELTEEFRFRGLRVTPQRQCIFGVLQGDVTHPSADAVFDAARRQMPTISLKTVYETLKELGEMGELAQLDLGTGRSRFDPNVERSHHHLVCERCGKVRDLFADLPGLQLAPDASGGFEVRRSEVIFRGRCEECRGPHAAGASGQESTSAGARRDQRQRKGATWQT